MCAAIGISHGMQEMERLAIEEWRGASPVYGDRLRKIMGIEGNDVEAIFKVLQLDPDSLITTSTSATKWWTKGTVSSNSRYCGALMDVEPFGDKMVTSMCHHIEDGTFDVTAQAINPKAHIRHVHRPPRVPTGRSPHCRWELIIDEDNETLEEADITKITRMTTAASFGIPPHARRDTPMSRAHRVRHDRCAGARGHPEAPDRAPGRSGPATGRRHRRRSRRGRLRRPDRPERRPPAGVAPATAYNYFSSKDHLLAELLWRRMAALPPVDITSDGPMVDRLAKTVRMMVLLTTESPDLVGACTTASRRAPPPT